MIDEKGEQLGILTVAEALSIAEERELDLVEMAAMADPPTCKLMDYGKFKFDQKKKGRGQKKTVQRRKEVKLRPKYDDHDFQVKLDRARRFPGAHLRHSPRRPVDVKNGFCRALSLNC